MKYDKLVRDKIPQIIQNSGKIAVTRVLNDSEYLLYLRTKLQEEVDEYLQSGECEELADILEVLLALAKADGRSKNELFTICQAKRDARGGFDDKILLLQVDE